MAAGDQVCDLTFRNPVTVSSDVDPGRDVVILSDAVVDYLKRLRDALCAELADLEARLVALEP